MPERERPEHGAILFSDLCKVLDQIGKERSTSRKAALFADFLKRIREEDAKDSMDAEGAEGEDGAKGAKDGRFRKSEENDYRSSDLAIALACRFAGEGAFDQTGGRRVGIGSHSIAVAASEFCGIDYDRVFKPCRVATGSGSETIELLMSNMPSVRERQGSLGWSLQEVDGFFEELSALRGRADKHERLFQIWQGMSPSEVKFMIRMMGQGSLRIGFETRSILNALALAFDENPEVIRHAHMITGSLAETALLLSSERLSEAEFRLFRPLSFMLASPLNMGRGEMGEGLDDAGLDGAGLEGADSTPNGASSELKSLNLEDYLVEEKFDGIRCQLHLSGDKVELFSRDLNAISGTFPDLLEKMVSKSLPSVVLDGEIVGFKEDNILPFQSLQRRLGVKRPSKDLLEEVPVEFIAYDLLFLEEKDLLREPLEKRREFLAKVCAEHQLAMSRSFTVPTIEDLWTAFQNAQAGGNEGLMLKKKESVYEFGQRRRSWMKVKQPEGALTTVILYAHAGSGKRGGLYSDFTLGISVREDERYEEEFIPIGKAYGGYSDEELKLINKRLKELTLERFGPTLLLRPELVVELEFDTIQVNRRTKAGYTLRFPRFRAIRWDLSSSDVNTLADVEHRIRERESRTIESSLTAPSSFFVPS